MIQCGNAFHPPCSTCKFYVLPISNKNNPDLGLCALFKNKMMKNKIYDKYNNNNEMLVKNYAMHCRNDENLCGKSGFAYEPINDNKNTNTNKVFENYEYVKSLCSSELTDEMDLIELEKLEKELMDMFQKIRRNNKHNKY